MVVAPLLVTRWASPVSVESLLQGVLLPPFVTNNHL